jgi:undecaprenyl-diphosphatase
MRDLLWNLVPWGLEMVAAVQNWATPLALEPAATFLWRAVSGLGSMPAYALAILLAAQYGGRRRLARLTLLLLVSLYVNALLKDLAGTPRPYLLAPGFIRAGAIMADSAFPSGHAQMAAAFWGALALARRRAWLTGLAAVAVAAVSLSRLALGVHYPQDVIAGALLGLMLAAAGRAGWSASERRLAAWPRAAQLGAALAGALVAVAVHPTATTATIAGGAAGLACGYLLAGPITRRPKTWRKPWPAWGS